MEAKKKKTIVDRRVYCARHGHSGIISIFFGYVSCARCGDQIGDTLDGCYDTTDCVIVGHNCETCESNFKKLKKNDLALVPRKILSKVKPGSKKISDNAAREK